MTKSFFKLVSILFILLFSLKNTNENIDDYGKCLYIDFGNTYIRMAVDMNSSVIVIPNDLGSYSTPNIIAFTDNEILIGEEAKKQAALNPKRTIYNLTRLIGRNFTDDKEFKKETELYPFNIINKDGQIFIQIEIRGEKKLYSPERLSAMILFKLKKMAQKYIGTKIDTAMFSVPRYFNDLQIRSIKKIGKMTPFKINEIKGSSYVALYGYTNIKTENKSILVFDLGGTFLDITIFKFDEDIPFIIVNSYEINDINIGGENFNKRIYEYFLNIINNKFKKDLKYNKLLSHKLMEEIEKAKINLSNSLETKIELRQSEYGFDFKYTLSRKEFEEINKDLFNKIIVKLDKVLQESGLEKKEISEFFLIGGSSKIPKIKTLINNYFNKTDLNEVKNPKEDEVILYGLTHQYIDYPDYYYRWCTLGQPFSSLSLGMETSGGIMSKFIPMDYIVVDGAIKYFTTDKDNQANIKINIYEGERLLTKYNRYLGSLELKGIPPAPRGTAKIEVIFYIFDAYDDGAYLLKLEVFAIEKNSGIYDKIIINNLTIFEEDSRVEEVKRIEEEAKKYEKDDLIIKERIESINKLDYLIYKIQYLIENIENIRNKFKEDENKIILNKIKEIELWLKNNQEADKEIYEEYFNNIKNIIEPIIGKIYHYDNKIQLETLYLK